MLQFDTYLRHRANLVDSTLVEVSQPVGHAALAGLLLYLAGSLVLQLAARSR